MTIILVGNHKWKNKIFCDYLTKHYVYGNVASLASIDKVKELTRLLSNSTNMKLASELQKIWLNYNKSIADDIKDYIINNKKPLDIIIVSVTDDKDVQLLSENINVDILIRYLDIYPNYDIINVAKDIIKQIEDDLSANKKENTV